MRHFSPEYKAACRQEFIGSDVRISTSGHPEYLSITGTVVDETKNTFHIATESGVKIVPKSGNTFQLGEHDIVGNQIMFRPEDRIKRFR